MNASLFNITQERKLLMEQLAESDGELTDGLAESLAINRSDFEEKAESYGIIMRKLQTDEIAIQSEIDRLTALQKSKSKSYDRLEATLLEALQLYGQQDSKGIWRAEVGTFRLSTARSGKTVNITDETLIPKEFVVVKTTESISKTTIKNALELGQVVPGAEFKEGNIRLVIK